MRRAVFPGRASCCLDPICDQRSGENGRGGGVGGEEGGGQNVDQMWCNPHFHPIPCTSAYQVRCHRQYITCAPDFSGLGNSLPGC